MGSSSKTVQENKPPAWAEPGFKQTGAEAQRLYNSGAGGNVYTGSTVAPLSGATTGGIEQMYNAGQSWDTSGTRPLFAGTGALALNNDYLSENAYREKALQPSLDRTAAMVRSTMSGMGRGGGGAETRALTESLGNIENQSLNDDWNRRAGMLSTGIGQAQQAATSMAGLDQQNFGNRLQGAGAALQAGGLIDQNNQANLSDYQNLWTALDNQDWNRLGIYQQALSGSAADYGTQTSRTKSSNPMAALGAVGSAMGGMK